MPAEKLLKQFNKMRAASPPRVVAAGYSWRFEFSGARQAWLPHKQGLVNSAIDELGALVLAVSDEPLDAGELGPLGLSVMAQAPHLCYVDHVVDFEALYKAAYLEIGYWYLFHPRVDDSVGRFLAASGKQSEPENLIRSGVADFVIAADVDDDAWTIAIAPSLQ